MDNSDTILWKRIICNDSQDIFLDGRPDSRNRLISFHWFRPSLTYIFQAKISKIYTWNIWGNFRNVSFDQVSVDNSFIGWSRFSYAWSKFFRRENRRVQIWKIEVYSKIIQKTWIQDENTSFKIKSLNFKVTFTFITSASSSVLWLFFVVIAKFLNSDNKSFSKNFVWNNLKKTSLDRKWVFFDIQEFCMYSKKVRKLKMRWKW